MFSKIQAVNVSNLSLRGCFGNKAVHVKHLTLTNTRFVGRTFLERGTALELIETDSEAVLTQYLFSRYYYRSYRSTLSIRPDNISLVEHNKKWIGGAMIIVHSNVNIVLSTFSENRAQLGGAIHAENSSVIDINATTFKLNAATSSLNFSSKISSVTGGGALYATDNCLIYIFISLKLH